MLKNINIKFTKRVFSHILFWIFSIAINAYAFKISNPLNWLDVYYSIYSHLCLITGAYINHFILFPLLFENRRYVSYILFSMANASLMVLLYFVTFSFVVDVIMPNYFFVSQFNVLETFIYVSAYLAFTTLLKLSESWFELQKKNKLMLLTEKENIDNQLKALKSQINPHFLFNSLNVIYSQSLKKTDDVPEIVIKLSDILRYVIYKSKNDVLKLTEEIQLINNYLDLQKYRINDDSNINFTSEVEIDHNIAPMLFLPLIENSFKHGIKGDYEDTYVNIELVSTSKETRFTIKNNKGEKPTILFDNEKGIGIENVKKRLLLLYPNRHQLLIKNEPDSFCVELKLTH